MGVFCLCTDLGKSETSRDVISNVLAAKYAEIGQVLRKYSGLGFQRRSLK